MGFFASSPQEHYQIGKSPGVTDPDPGSRGKIDEGKVSFFRRRVYFIRKMCFPVLIKSVYICMC